MHPAFKRRKKNIPSLSHGLRSCCQRKATNNIPMSRATHSTPNIAAKHSVRTYEDSACKKHGHRKRSEKKKKKKGKKKKKSDHSSTEFLAYGYIVKCRIQRIHHAIYKLIFWFLTVFLNFLKFLAFLRLPPTSINSSRALYR